LKLDGQYELKIIEPPDPPEPEPDLFNQAAQK
jgi:hypothetical protein